MLINTNIKIKQLNGDDFLNPDKTEVTVKAVILDALSTPIKEEPGSVKFEKYGLAKKIYETDEVELLSENISLIKELVGKLYAPIIVGFVWDVLEGKINEEERKEGNEN
jgi:hypothetical protein